MKKKDVSLIEVWKYDKESRVVTELVAIIANGVPIRVYDGYFAEMRDVPYEVYKNQIEDKVNPYKEESGIKLKNN